MKHARVLCALALTAVLSACTTTAVYEGTSFIKPPEDVSTVWIGEDGGVYLVPEKGVVITQIVDRQGNDLQWKVVGSYLNITKDVMDSAEGTAWLVIEGKKRRLDYYSTAEKR